MNASGPHFDAPMTLQFIRHPAGDQFGAEAAAAGACGLQRHAGFAPLGPEPFHAILALTPPGDLQAPALLPQRAVLHAIGRELVDGQRQDLRGLGRELHRRA